MAFGEYYNSMDREHQEKELVVNPGELGISTIITRDAIQPIVGRIHAGANQVEIGFLGAGKGDIFSGSTNPETWGKEHRQAIRELAEINKVELSTHASVKIAGFAGQGQEGFSKQQQAEHMKEIKRAVEFAADTAQGGAIVVHTSEWQRPVSLAASWLNRPENKERMHLLGKFEKTEKEIESAQIFVADKETGQLQALRRNMKIPEIKMKDGKPVLKPDGSMEVEEITFEKIVEKARNEFSDPNMDEGVAFMKYYNKSKIQQSKGELAHLEYRREDIQRDLKRLQDANDPQLASVLEQRKKMLQQLNEQEQSIYKNVHELEKDRWVSVQEEGMKRSTQGMVEAAMYALEQEKKKGLKKDLYIAPENLMPDWGYGSHPQELKELVIQSRKAMKEKLVQEKKMSESEAEKVANNHIRATIDIGHVNTWRKFFKGDDKAFDKWMVENVRDLLKAKVLGHIHMSDNFGYEDEHLTVGEGNIPMKEFMKELRAAEKEGGPKINVIVETGAQPPEQQQQALYGAWAYFGSSVYGAATPKVGLFDRWTDVQNSYFGRTSSPNYVVGDFRPSEDWTIWSGTNLE